MATDSFMRIRNPKLADKEHAPMFGASLPKFVETEAIDPEELPEVAAAIVAEPTEGPTCEVCGFIAKSEFGLKAHSRKHK